MVAGWWVVVGMAAVNTAVVVVAFLRWLLRRTTPDGATPALRAARRANRRDSRHGRHRGSGPEAGYGGDGQTGQAHRGPG